MLARETKQRNTVPLLFVTGEALHPNVSCIVRHARGNVMTQIGISTPILRVRALVLGGKKFPDGPGQTNPKAEVFSPATGTWTRAREARA